MVVIVIYKKTHVLYLNAVWFLVCFNDLLPVYNFRNTADNKIICVWTHMKHKKCYVMDVNYWWELYQAAKNEEYVGVQKQKEKIQVQCFFRAGYRFPWVDKEL